MVLWRVVKRLPYIEDARCLKVNIVFLNLTQEKLYFCLYTNSELKQKNNARTKYLN